MTQTSRHDFETPHNVGILDLNGPDAFTHYGLEPRDYPGLIPSVDTAIAFAGEAPLVLQPWQRELHIHAELVAVIGRDVRWGEEDVEDALAGYSIGLGIWDNAMVNHLKNNLPRDATLNQHYAYLIDDSRQQGDVILTPDALPSIREIQLTLHIPGCEPAVYAQNQLMFDGIRLLRECNKLMGFCRGDVLCLGPVAAPVVIDSHDHFPQGSDLRVTGSPFPDLNILVDDQRDGASDMPWPGCDVDFITRYPQLRQ